MRIHVKGLLCVETGHIVKVLSECQPLLLSCALVIDLHIY